jgi:hypothetical protein
MIRFSGFPSSNFEYFSLKISGERKFPFSSRFSEKGILIAPGICPATRSIGSDSPL